MSTILDALKRVQRDREQARPLDLRESVTAVEAPLRRKPRRRTSRLPLLLAIFALGAGVLGYQRLQLLLGADDDLLEVALAAPAPQPGIGVPPPAPDPFGTVPVPAPSEPVTVPVPVVPEPGAEPALVPSPAPEYPVAQAAPPRAPRVPRSLPGQAGASDSDPRAVAAAPGAPPTAAPDRVQPQTPPGAVPEARAPVGKPATRTYPSLPRRLPARSRDVARVGAERPRSAAPSDVAEPKRADADDFPEIRVANVVWHPEPARRRAEVTIEQTRLVDAREGDIVKGIEVEKIEPGAVEFKLGSALKTVRIGP